jgi:hypothetical protein
MTEFEKFKNSLPESHWAKYDISAVRLGFEAATDAALKIISDYRNEGHGLQTYLASNELYRRIQEGKL